MMENDKEKEQLEKEEKEEIKHTWTLEDELEFNKKFWDQEEKEEIKRYKLRKRYFDMRRKDILENGKTDM